MKSTLQETKNARSLLSRRSFIGTTAAGLMMPISLESGLSRAAAQDAQSVVIGLNADLTTMDPHADTSIQGFTVWHHVFDGLTAQDGDSKLIPALAESWEIISPTHWRFKLRRGVTFHDGQPLTSVAVKTSLERIIAPQTKSPQAFLWSTLARVETPDESTADIILKGPNAALLRNLSITAILPPNADTTAGFFEKPVGTGPFRLDVWRRGAGLQLSSFREYWGEKPKVEKVEFKILPAASTRRSAVQAGEVDITTALPPEQAAMLRGARDIKVLTRSLNQSQVIQFNVKKAPFNDPRVRQALNYGTDKESLLKSIELGFGKVMTAPMPPAVPGFNNNLEPYSYDPDRARKLLAEAGVSNLSMELTGFRGFFATGPTQQQAIAEQWRQLGVNVTANDLEFGRLIEQRGAGNFDAIYTVWSVLTADPDFALARNFQSGNVFGYDNPQVSKLLAEGAATMDPDKRAEVYASAQKLIWDDCPWVWLWYPDSVVIARSRVTDYTLRADGLISARRLSLAT
jgi:peptide/nickel transport system substrate-binding protein